MKRFLFLIIALFILSAGNAFATQSTDVRTATYADKDSSLLYRMASYRDPNGDGYFVYAPDTGIQYPYLESTTNLTLAYYQSGVILGLYPYISNTHITLPEAVPGMDYYIVDGNPTFTWKVEIQSDDYIAFSGNTLGVGISNTSAAQGDQIELFCVFAGQWLVKDKLGTWVTGS